MSTIHWREWLGGPSTASTPSESTSDLNVPKYELEFCSGSETIVMLGAVWKRRALSSHIRALILTSQPRLLYVDPTNMELKGEIPWSRECPVHVIVDSNSKLFDVVSPLNSNRAYHFEVFGQGDALAWENAINSALTAQREAVAPQVKSHCALCQKTFGFMRPSHQCQVCQRSVCADCSDSPIGNPGQQPPQGAVTVGASPGRRCKDCAGKEAGAPDLPWLSSTSFLFNLPGGASDADSHGGGDSAVTSTPGTDDSNAISRTPLQSYAATPHCNACRETFHTTTRRRQWCRHCGLMFCQACSSATFPLEAYDMYPQRVCDECAYELVRSTAAARSCQLLYGACSIFCWARCCGRRRAERWMPKERLVLRLQQLASPFGPLWGRFKLDFLKPPQPKGPLHKTVANKTAAPDQELQTVKE